MTLCISRNNPHWKWILLLLVMSMISVTATEDDTQQSHDKHQGSTSISIIMPVYERPALLVLALEQIGQTNYEGKMEIVVMDDSEKAMDENNLISHFSLFNEEEGRTLVYRHLNRRVTVGEKRNMACALSSGEIVVMMDDDDIYDPDRILYQIEPIMNGRADMTVLRQGVWLQLYDDERPSKFFQATPRMERSVHYGTLIFRREIWNPEMGTVYTDASLLDEVDFYNKVKSSSQIRVLEMPNNGMHVYVRHHNNINRPGTDVARDPRFWPTARPKNVPLYHLARLEQTVTNMYSPERSLQSKPQCGGCIEVDSEIEGGSRCVSADDCWGNIDSVFQDWNIWDGCMNQDSPCTGCQKSSDDICEDRCVLIGLGPCKTFDQCYDMYADYPLVDCDRFPTCDCNSAAPPTDLPTYPPTEDDGKIKCGACIDNYGPCFTADQCWDMYSDYPELVWDQCMDVSGGSSSPCSGCKKSSDDICSGRCVSTNGPCQSLDDCYDMYANSSDIDCDRFPTCDCSLPQFDAGLISTTTSTASTSGITTTKATGSTILASTITSSGTTTTKATSIFSNVTQASDTSSKPTKPSTINTKSPSNEPTESPSISDFDISQGQSTLARRNGAKIVFLVLGSVIAMLL